MEGATCQTDLSYAVTDEVNWSLSATLNIGVTTKVELAGTGVEEKIE